MSCIPASVLSSADVNRENCSVDTPGMRFEARKASNRQTVGPSSKVTLLSTVSILWLKSEPELPPLPPKEMPKALNPPPPWASQLDQTVVSLTLLKMYLILRPRTITADAMHSERSDATWGWRFKVSAT